MSQISLPRALNAARWCLFVNAAISFITAVGGLIAAGVSAAVLGSMTWVLLPGILALVFALRLPRGGGTLFWSICTLQVLLVLMALGNLFRGEPSGLTQMVLPVLTIVLVTRPSSRDRLLR